MKAKYYVAGILTAILVVFATGADSKKTSPKATQWEYAHLQIAVLGKEAKCAWHGDSDLSEQLTGTHELVAEKLGVDSGEADLLFLLNYVGERGWELCSQAEQSYIKGHKETAYYFKRPKR